MGAEVTFYTALGSDGRSQDVLEAHGVRVEAARRDRPQTEVLALLDPAGERTLFVVGENDAPVAADPLPWDEIAADAGCYFTGYDPETVRLGRRAPVLVVTARRFDALVASGVRADALVGSGRDRGERFDLDRLAEQPRHVIVTDGAHGGSGYDAAPVPGPIVDITAKPQSVTVAARSAFSLTASGVDQFGNAVADGVTWTISPEGLGRIEPQSGGTAIFTAGPRGGTGQITASVSGVTGPLSADVLVTVRPGRIVVSSVRYGIGRKALLVSATVIDSSRRPVEGAVVRLIVRRNGYRYFLGQGRTAANGRVIYRLRSKKGCYRTAIIRASAPGYVWRPATPQNRFCK